MLLCSDAVFAQEGQTESGAPAAENSAEVIDNPMETVVKYSDYMLKSMVRAYAHNIAKNERYKEALGELIINFSDKTVNCTRMFTYCHNLESIGDFNNFKPSNTGEMFHDCWRLKHLPKFNNCDFS